MFRSTMKLMAVLLVSLALLGQAGTALAAADEDSFAYAVTTVARADIPAEALPDTLPPNPILPPSPIAPRGYYVSYVATTLPPNPILPPSPIIGDGG